VIASKPFKVQGLLAFLQTMLVFLRTGE
jgi:hypothetical protein